MLCGLAIVLVMIVGHSLLVDVVSFAFSLVPVSFSFAISMLSFECRLLIVLAFPSL